MNLAARRALYGKMASDTTLSNLLGSPAAGYTKSIYFGVAPSEAGFPYIVFSKVSGTPTYTFKQGTAVFENEVWMVRATDHNTTADQADAIADRLEVLLTDASLSISGASHKYLRKESDISYPEITSGETYHHSGANWRLIAEPT